MNKKIKIILLINIIPIIMYLLAVTFEIVHGAMSEISLGLGLLSLGILFWSIPISIIYLIVILLKKLLK